ncbi:MAG: hypothetical protein JWM98_1540, partial [Thermoleophilia bacterium]|nr:hypothetical protein [Thermoleophilia bacterium]
AQGEAAGGRSATGAAPSGDGAPAADTAGGTAAPVPPVAGAPTDVLAEDQICIATRDESRLVLPDGRIPRQVVAGPLGTYIVCG